MDLADDASRLQQPSRSFQTGHDCLVRFLRVSAGPIHHFLREASVIIHRTCNLTTVQDDSILYAELEIFLAETQNKAAWRYAKATALRQETKYGKSRS
jgi:hypothetical protein